LGKKRVPGADRGDKTPLERVVVELEFNTGSNSITIACCSDQPK
jgi:hypothetical protein